VTRAVVYTRFSPRRNAAECVSCQTQEEACRAYAEARGYEVVAVHGDEGVSGDVVSRPGLSAALADLEPGDVLLVHRPDRLARDLLLNEMLYQRATKLGARIEAVEGDVGRGSDPQSVLVRQILASVAEFEHKLIAARTRVAMRAAQRRGRKVSCHTPYGWTSDGAGNLVPLPDEQRALERVLELRGEGLTAYAAAQVLNEEHPEACRGQRWSPKTVAKCWERQGGVIP